jgi:arylsulfatase A-like enzyme
LGFGWQDSPIVIGIKAGLPLDQLLISEFLKQNGYHTCAIGKWHPGDHPKFWQNQRGFDDWFGFYGGGFNYWGNLRNKTPQQGILRDGKPVNPDEITYLTVCHKSINSVKIKSE